MIVLFNKTFEHKVNRVKTDKNGNFIILELNTEGKLLHWLTYMNLMKISLSFMKILKQKVSECGNVEVIILEDWNLCLDPEKNCENYLHINNPIA